MSFRKKATKFKQSLDERHKESAERKDESMFSSIFLMEKLKRMMPNGVNFWRPAKGDHEIDIIPFIAGKNHPRDKEGEPSYLIDIWVYRFVGSMKESFVSPARNFKIIDPIAEYINTHNLSTQQFKKHSADRRVVYLVWVHDTAEEEAKGLQIWEVAHFYMEANLTEISKKPREGGYIPFSHWDHGKRIAFSIQSSGKYIDGDGIEREGISYKGHRFIDRPSPIPEEILDQSFPLDETIEMRPSYEKIYEAFYAKKVSDGKETEETNEEVEENETEETPDEVEEGTCPYGGSFGEDNDQLEDCSSCGLWDNCSDAQLESSIKSGEEETEEEEEETEEEEEETEEEESPPSKKKFAKKEEKTPLKKKAIIRRKK